MNTSKNNQPIDTANEPVDHDIDDAEFQDTGVLHEPKKSVRGMHVARPDAEDEQ